MADDVRGSGISGYSSDFCGLNPGFTGPGESEALEDSARARSRGSGPSGPGVSQSDKKKKRRGSGSPGPGNPISRSIDVPTFQLSCKRLFTN